MDAVEAMGWIIDPAAMIHYPLGGIARHNAASERVHGDEIVAQRAVPTRIGNVCAAQGGGMTTHFSTQDTEVGLIGRAAPQKLHMAMMVEDQCAIGAVMTDAEIDHRMVQRPLRVIVQQVAPDTLAFGQIVGQASVGILTLSEIEKVNGVTQGVNQPPGKSTLFDDKTLRQANFVPIIGQREDRRANGNLGSLILNIAKSEDVGLLIAVVGGA